MAKKITLKSKTETPVVTEEKVQADEKELPSSTKKNTNIPKSAQKKRKTFEQTDRIKCRSVTQGGLYLDGAKTKQPYSFDHYDDETEIEYRDLVALVIGKSSYIFNPYFIVEDPDFVAEFPQLQKFYDESYEIQDLKDILKMPFGQMEEALKRLPSGAAENLKIIASAQVSDGELDSVKKIKILNEFFGIDLNMIAEFSKP